MATEESNRKTTFVGAVGFGCARLRGEGAALTLSHVDRAPFLFIVLACLLLFTLSFVCFSPHASAQTAAGEIEKRPAPVACRKCLGGAHAGSLCRQDVDCPGSKCPERNVFNISVAVHYEANPAELNVIKGAIGDLSAVLFDVTDGQAEIGQATIYNNAFGSTADLRIYPVIDETVVPAVPGVWWTADVGSWKVGGAIHVSYDVLAAAPAAGESLTHEFVHLVFDARDEYESRAVGCGDIIGSAHCPHADAVAAGENGCLMDEGGLDAGDPGTELCWGQGDPSNLTDVASGNHDAESTTEQSRCRSGRSCWDQVVWSWPGTFLAPAGMPDPAANGATVDATHFNDLDQTHRIVLVLDSSGSMGMGSGASTRMARLKVAAYDFVMLAENGTELGIVSFSGDADPAKGHAHEAIAQLGNNRAKWVTAIGNLSPGGRTNIGDGLQKAGAMITAAGGVTANTFIVLMTDGLNNEPLPNAVAHLQSNLAGLLSQGIPVYVTCTGTDMGLASQCSEIASATNGFYVDSADAAHLQEAFVDLQEKTHRREAIDSARGKLSQAVPKTVFVEAGARSVSFVLMLKEAGAEADFFVVDPRGVKHRTRTIPQGRYSRFSDPDSGEWTMVIHQTGEVDSAYIARAYSKNQLAELRVSARHARVSPGEELYVYAYPRFGGPVSHSQGKISGTVRRPDGEIEAFELYDRGRAFGPGGDDLADDGIYTGVYKATREKGAYTFHLRMDADKWLRSGDSPRRNRKITLPRFAREVRLSAAVGHPADIR